MKLNFKDDTFGRYSFKDLEYGLELLKDQLWDKLGKLYEGTKVRASIYELERICAQEIDPIKLKITLVENELGERMLTGNDDGMLEQELLGG